MPSSAQMCLRSTYITIDCVTIDCDIENAFDNNTDTDNDKLI